jgi:hypothetical protein
MSNFDIEQCKKDGGLAIHEQLGEVKIIVFEKDSDGHLVAQRFKNKTYYFTSEGFLANIPKKKKITIYVYLDDKNQIRSALEDNSLELNEYLNRKFKIIKTIKEEIDI